MILLGIIIVVFNFLFLISGFFIINNRINNKILNRDVLNNIKDEINKIVIKLNDTTLNNISIIEEKKKELDKLIILSDKKISGLKSSLFPVKKESQTVSICAKPAYSQQKVVKQSNKNTEIKRKEEKEINDSLKNLSIVEKVNFLVDLNWKKKEIIKKLGISSGELELILNMENIRDHALDL